MWKPSKIRGLDKLLSLLLLASWHCLSSGRPMTKKGKKMRQNSINNKDSKKQEIEHIYLWSLEVDK